MDLDIDNSVEQGLITKSFKGFKLKKFPDLSKWTNCTLINFSLNPIVDFQGMQSLPNLKDIYLDNTKLSSFRGVPELPSLETISIKSTPINAYKKADIMCVIAFGCQLVLINGEEIRRDKLRFAQQNRDVLLPYLRDGWLLTSINPIRFIHSKTRQRITVKTSLSLFPKSNENKSNNNNQAKEAEKEANNEEEDEVNAQEVAEEGRSEHTVYEASESNESQSDNQNEIKAEKTIKQMNNNLTITLKKKNVQEKTLFDESENKKKYRKESTSIRHILRRPGGIKVDPFTFNYAITVKEKPLPEIQSPIGKISPSPKKKPKLTINTKPNPNSIQQEDEDTFDGGNESFGSFDN
ncbi:hypothetical protein M9Y10_032752 [Tritrichomonas musculus]|uniref:Leucine Rich Repeat family protein n=1 Tax=Tritrichomonas musculus TaxID=1915356 RepID=A0ABR2GYJ1_9EUKA